MSPVTIFLFNFGTAPTVWHFFSILFYIYIYLLIVKGIGNLSVKHRHRGHFSELEIGENKAELTLPQVLHQNPFKKFMDLSLNNLRYGYLHY